MENPTWAAYLYLAYCLVHSADEQVAMAREQAEHELAAARLALATGAEVMEVISFELGE